MKKSNHRQEPKFNESDYQDLALIASIKRKDQLACKRLFKKYSTRLSRRFYTNFKSKDELKDVIMEIMEKVFENIHRYEMDYTFNAWITALAKNYLVDYFRSKKTRVSDINSFSVDTVYQNDSGSSMKFDIPSDEPEMMTAKPEVERQAKLEYIYGAIEKLPENSIKEFPEETRKLFSLYRDANSSMKSFANNSGLDYKSIKNQLDLVERRYKQAEREKNIMIMYLRDNMTYETIRKKLNNMDMRLLKVTIWRTKQKIADLIDVRKAVIEISTKYSVEQLQEKSFVPSVNNGEKTGIRVR